MVLKIKPVTVEMGEEALRKLAKLNNKSVKEMQRFFDEWSNHTIRAMNKREMLGKRAMRSLFEKWKVSADAKRLVCVKNRAHKIEPKEIVFSSRYDGEVLMACTECDCSYTIPDIILVDTE